MADTRDIEMEIYGSITSLGTIKALAAEMDGHVAPEFGETYLDEWAAFTHIVQCLETGDPIRVVRDETSDDLDAIAGVCEEHGLSYCIKGHKTQWIDAMLETWAPGFDGPKRLNIDEEHNIVVTLDELRKLANKGLEPIVKHIEALDHLALNDIERKVTSTPEVLEEARNYDPDEEVTPAP